MSVGRLCIFRISQLRRTQPSIPDPPAPRAGKYRGISRVDERERKVDVACDDNESSGTGGEQQAIRRITQEHISKK